MFMYKYNMYHIIYMKMINGMFIVFSVFHSSTQTENTDLHIMRLVTTYFLGIFFF